MAKPIIAIFGNYSKAELVRVSELAEKQLKDYSVMVMYSSGVTRVEVYNPLFIEPIKLKDLKAKVEAVI